jgi:hypothetical protein
VESVSKAKIKIMKTISAKTAVHSLAL